MGKIKCPECRKALEEKEEEIERGDIVYCPACAVEFEVVGTAPVLLRGLEEDDEDDAEDDDEDDSFAENEDDDPGY